MVRRGRRHRSIAGAIHATPLKRATRTCPSTACKWVRYHWRCIVPQRAVAAARMYACMCKLLCRIRLAGCMGFLWVNGCSFFHCVASPFHSCVTTLPYPQRHVIPPVAGTEPDVDLNVCRSSHSYDYLIKQPQEHSLPAHALQSSGTSCMQAACRCHAIACNWCMHSTAAAPPTCVCFPPMLNSHCAPCKRCSVCCVHPSASVPFKPACAGVHAVHAQYNWHTVHTAY